jgi:hypothetical protein
MRGDYTHGSQGHCLGWLQLLSHYHNDPDSNNNCRMGWNLTLFSWSATVPHLLIGLWLAIDKVIHHDNVDLPIIRLRNHSLEGSDRRVSPSER